MGWRKGLPRKASNTMNVVDNYPEPSTRDVDDNTVSSEEEENTDQMNEDNNELEDEPQQEAEMYSVESVVGKRKHKRYNKVQYLIKWLGYDESQNTWEYVHNLECQEMIDKFEESLKPRKESKFVETALIIGCLLMAFVFPYMFISTIEFP